MAKPSKIAGGAGLRVANLDKFTLGLDKVAATFLQELAHRGKRMAIRVVRAAKRRAPVNTGQMRAGITWLVGRKGNRIFIRVGTAVKHGFRTEFPNTYLPKSPNRTPRGGGTVDRPYTAWTALRMRGGSGQTMPWLRPALVSVLRQWAKGEVQAAAKAALR